MKSYAFLLPPGVLRTKVSFLVRGAQVVGELYTPTTAKGVALPGVVFAGPLSSVKEQSTGAYSAALSQHGYACLSLDHRTFGESEGTPRQYENYKNKIEDLSAAVDWLSERDDVDSSRIGTCGVCLGAAYAASMAVQENLRDKVKAVAFVVGLFPRGGDPSEEGIAARKHYEETGEVRMIKAASVTEDAAMPMQIAVDYYDSPDRALVANYRNEVALMYRERWQEYDAMLVAPELTQPLCMIHGKQSFAVDSGMKFYNAASKSNHKSLHWIDTLPHTDFYDNKDAIAEIGSILDKHFKEYL